ncbi:glycosyltransferase family 2 protein [Protaetiibacter larvae]|uniref:Glycosyltransferase family 2 protein n=1 Tax=Protaetiibacter larvae TaxID=2592654 RepID=A0A5C1Y6Z2_9MICO|nr:glycosyltransferase family 2 protein [Protaetiibacter larvae]QEO08627.1 glycosyltransferase family 2 protein [Protaetiibacter larvae]
MSTTPRVSIVIPAYNEGEAIIAGLDRIAEAVQSDAEVLIVVDTPDDTTVAPVNAYSAEHPAFRIVVNDYGRGPAHAIRYGIDAAAARTVVVTMADGCDDPRQIDDLVLLVERGVVIAAASRYMPGGQQVGGPRFKSFLSRTAGKSLQFFTNAGTRDATNSFKAYDTEFVRRVGIDSRDGFEIGLELTAKARRLRLPVAEIPTIWLDRTYGQSHFQLSKWIPKYLRWYRFAFGPQLTPDQLVTKAQRNTP